MFTEQQSKTIWVVYLWHTKLSVNLPQAYLCYIEH